MMPLLNILEKRTLRSVREVYIRPMKLCFYRATKATMMLAPTSRALDRSRPCLYAPLGRTGAPVGLLPPVVVAEPPALPEPPEPEELEGEGLPVDWLEPLVTEVVMVWSATEDPVQRAANPLGVLPVLDRDTEGGGRGLDVELAGTEFVQGSGPIEGLGDPRRLEELVVGADRVRRADNLLGQRRRHLGGPARDDLQLAGQARVVDPVV